MNIPARTLVSIVVVLSTSIGTAPVFAQTVPRFETRSPRVCDEIRSKPSPQEAAALIQCRQESITEGEVYLLENVRVQIGGGQSYRERDHVYLTGVDTSQQVYPLRGSFKSYRCVRLKDSEPGKNCVTVTQTAATGYCWPTTFGTWDCVMSGPNSDVVQDQPPPS